MFRLKVTTLYIWTVSFERSSSLSEYKKEIDLRISNRISTKTGSRPIYGGICGKRWIHAVENWFTYS